MARKGKQAASGSTRGTTKAQAQAQAQLQASSHLNLQDLPDDVLLKILGLVSVERSAELLAAMWTSKRLRSLARNAALWAEPVFHRQDSPQLFLAMCKAFGASFRRVCLSALPWISVEDAVRGLEHAKSITHLSLAYFAGRARPGAATARRPDSDIDRDHDRDETDVTFDSLPKLNRLEQLNVTDVFLSAECLRAVLKASSRTLTRVYCCHTAIRVGDEEYEADCENEYRRRHGESTPESSHSEPAGSVLPAFAGLSFPKLAQLDLSGAVCSEAGVEALACSLPALRELFLVGPRKHAFEFEDEEEDEDEDADEDERQRWDPKDLAARLAEKKPGLDVVHEDFMDLVCRAIEAEDMDPHAIGYERPAQLWAKAHSLLPIVRRCAGIDAPTWSGGTLLHYVLACSSFSAAVRLVDEFGASPLALAFSRSYRAQRDPWSAPYPVPHYSLPWQAQASPFESVLHLSASDEQRHIAIEDRPNDRMLVDELPEIFRRWGLAKLVNLQTKSATDGVGDSPLHLSVRQRRGGIRVLPLKPEVLLELGADPTLQDKQGQTPAHKLSLSPDPPVLKLLLERSPQLVNIADKLGKTPLILFLDRLRLCEGDGEADWLPRVRESIQLLLETPCLNAGIADKQGRTALHFGCLEVISYGIIASSDRRAACAAVLRALLGRSDVDPNAADNEGCTPLFLAASASPGHSELVQSLLEAGAGRLSIDAAAKDGRTPLFVACERQDALIVRLLLEAGADPNLAPTGRAGPHRTFFRAYMDRPARESSELAAVRALFRAKKGNKNVFGPRAPADDFGRTALHRAADPQRSQDVPKRSAEDCLFDEANPARALAARNPAGETPLVIACKTGNGAAAAACLKQSPLLAADLDGVTALHHCVRNANLEQIAVSILASCPEAANAADVEGRTPLHELVSVANSARGFSYYKPQFANVADKLAPVSNLLAQDSRGRTPLHAAAKWQCPIEILKTMLACPQAAAALAIRDKTGSTPLHLACQWMCSEEHVRAMLAAGAPAATARDSEGRLAAEVAPPALRRVIEAFLQETKPSASSQSRKRKRAAAEDGAEGKEGEEPTAGRGGGAGGRGGRRSSRRSG